MVRYKKLYRPQRQNRYEKLLSEGFAKAEARQLSRLKFNLIYIRQMRVDRRSLVRKAKSQKLSLLQEIKKLYQQEDWKDAYAMMRTYRGRAIASGDYIAPPVKKRTRIDKGRVQEQKARWKAKQANRQPTGRGARYPVLKDGKPTGEEIRFNYDTGRFEPV